jgi:hypothetical protein
MSLDGGASSGLYYNGQYLTHPGRNLSNALVVKVLENPPIYLNGERLYLDSDAFITNGVSMVPLRGVFERLAAEVKWDPKAKQITIQQEGSEIMMWLESTNAMVNGEQKVLSQAPIIKQGRSHIPLRFVVETLGAEVNWDQENFKIDINGKR